MEELLTVEEVARQLRVDDTSIRRWIHNGALEAVRLPHRGKRISFRIKRSVLEALLAGQDVSRPDGHAQAPEK